jgi:hypothetical protein
MITKAYEALEGRVIRGTTTNLSKETVWIVSCNARFSSSQDVNPHGKALNPNIPKFFEFVTCHRLWNLWEPTQVFFE